MNITFCCSSVSDVDEWLKQCSSEKFIKVGATITIGSSVLSDIMLRLSAEHRDLKSYVYVGNTQEIEERILSGDLDIALVEGNTHSKNIEAHVAMDDYMVIICGKAHRFYGCDSVSLEDLKDENFILREHGSGTRAQLEDLLHRRQISYSCTWECHNAESIKRAVMDGHGISYISERLVHQDCENGCLWACSIRKISTLRHFSIILLKGKACTEVQESFKKIVYEYAEQERNNRHINKKTNLMDLQEASEI